MASSSGSFGTDDPNLVPLDLAPPLSAMRRRMQETQRRTGAYNSSNPLPETDGEETEEDDNEDAPAAPVEREREMVTLPDRRGLRETFGILWSEIGNRGSTCLPCPTNWRSMISGIMT